MLLFLTKLFVRNLNRILNQRIFLEFLPILRFLYETLIFDQNFDFFSKKNGKRNQKYEIEKYKLGTIIV